MNKARSISSARRASVAVAVLSTVIGCGLGRAGLGAGARPAALSAGAAVPADNYQRLAHLHAQREAARGGSDYVLGKGDLISVRAFELKEMNQRVRVESEGTITLPLLDTVAVAGRTVAEVEQDLTQRLGKYMYEPHVSVFVEDYRGQQVSVLGAVQKPGLVSQMGRNATVLDTISAAGGMTFEAGSLVYFMPAESRPQPDGRPLAGTVQNGLASGKDGAALGNGAPIVLDTSEMDEEGRRLFFSKPVRGGDVVRVPSGGNFFASGLLGKPGTYPLRAGLTLRGAIAAAQGFTFPAKTSRVRIYHPGPSGVSELREVNYDDIAALRTPDVFIHDGDVVEVAYPPIKLVPWAAYKFITDMIRVGYRVVS